MDHAPASTGKEPKNTMSIKNAPLKGVSAKGLRVISAGGVWLASLGLLAAEELKQDQLKEDSIEKEEEKSS